MNAKRRYRRLRAWLRLAWFAYGPPDQVVVRWYRPSRFQLEFQAAIDGLYEQMKSALSVTQLGAGERRS